MLSKCFRICQESQFCFRNYASREMDKQGNIDRKHDVFATMFPSLPGRNRVARSHSCAYVKSFSATTAGLGGVSRHLNFQYLPFLKCT